MNTKKTSVKKGMFGSKTRGIEDHMALSSGSLQTVIYSVLKKVEDLLYRIFISLFANFENYVVY